MIQAFDLRTAYLLLGLMALTASLAVFASLRVRLSQGNLLWVAAGLSFGAACVFLSLRGYVPDAVSFEGTHAGLAAAFVFHAAAVAHEGARRPSVWPLLGLVAASLLVYHLVRRIDPVHGLGYTLLVCGVGSAVILAIAAALWQRRRQAGAAVIALAFACLLAGVVARIWFLPGSWERGGPLEAGAHQVGLLVGGFLAVILAHVGYLGLQFDRLSGERIAIERQAAVEGERAQQTAPREATLRDLLAERNEMIQRLARSEAASELARFATGLPHDLSQPLCASRLNLETLLRQLEAAAVPETALALVRALEANNEQVLLLLQQLRILLRTQEETGRSPLNLASLVAQTLPVMEASFRDSGANLAMVLPQAPALVEGHQTQLQQLLLILCINVLDVVRAGGQPAGDCVVRVDAEAPDAQVCLVIEGPQPVADPPRPRLDMGLAIAQRIAQAHHGRLEPAGPGGFRLWLPAADPQLPPARARWPR